ncbi:MAG: PIN domain-containing protein [Acidobacteria bacterium]|nr:PIN domain-containing protein [Acidobacteriota bacterium]
MSGRVFLDTNIFVYAIDGEAPPSKSSRAAAVVHDALQSRTGVISYQVVQEFINVARKGHPGITEAHLIRVLDSMLFPMLQVHSSSQLFREAMQLASRFQFPWYDSLIVAAALEAGCTILYSEDLQHGMKVANLTIINPFTESRLM